jgi:hypothetical protein
VRVRMKLEEDAVAAHGLARCVFAAVAELALS